MARKAKITYATPDSNGWRKASDDLFLAQFRGLPCEVCGATSKMYNGRKTRSCFHHLLEKNLHRLHRYNKALGVILCPDHHGHHSRELSPHSDDTYAQLRFYNWLYHTKKSQHNLAFLHGTDSWDNSFTYKEMYVRLGGQITEGLKKDQKPLNHAAAVDKAEAGR